MTEQDLIQRAREGERTAIEALYQKYAPRVYAVVRRLAGEDALAEDWAQEAWVRAIRALPCADPASPAGHDPAEWLPA